MPKVKQKILRTLKVIEELDQIPATYFKHLTGTDGLYDYHVGFSCLLSGARLQIQAISKEASINLPPKLTRAGSLP